LKKKILKQKLREEKPQGGKIGCGEIFASNKKNKASIN
jgi:hypothetical protein